MRGALDKQLLWNSETKKQRNGQDNRIDRMYSKLILAQIITNWPMSDTHDMNCVDSKTGCLPRHVYPEMVDWLTMAHRSSPHSYYGQF